MNWTKGIDQKTGKPIDYDPAKDIQIYAGMATSIRTNRTKKMCPSAARRQQLLAAPYSPRTKLLYIPSAADCDHQHRPRTAQRGPGLERRQSVTTERWESDLIAADPITGEIKNRPTCRTPTSPARSRPRAGWCSSPLLDGTVAAYDDTSLTQLWKINVGSASRRRR